MSLKKILVVLISAFSLQLPAQLLPIYGGERAGLSTLSFLKNDLNPRSLGMGGASVANDGDAYSIISNPASLSLLDENSFAVSHTFLGAGLNQSFASGVFQLEDKISSLGFSVNALNSGAMKERTEFQPGGTGRDVYLTNMAIGATYTRQLSALFSAGVSLKYIYEGIANYTNSTITTDVAFLYTTDVKDLQFAVMIQNFGGNSTLGNGQDDIPVLFNRNTGISLDENIVPTVFKLGASFVPYESKQQSLTIAGQLNHPNDNAENYRLGAEYEYLNIFYARAGYRVNVKGQGFPTFGFSLKHRLGHHPFYIDYAANPTEFLGLQNSIGLRLRILNEDSKSR